MWVAFGWADLAGWCLRWLENNAHHGVYTRIGRHSGAVRTVVLPLWLLLGSGAVRCRAAWGHLHRMHIRREGSHGYRAARFSGKGLGRRCGLNGLRRGDGRKQPELTGADGCLPCCVAGETSARTSLRSSRRLSPCSTTVALARSRCAQPACCIRLRGLRTEPAASEPLHAPCPGVFASQSGKPGLCCARSASRRPKRMSRRWWARRGHRKL